MIAPEMAADGRRRLAELAAEYGRPVPRLAVGGGILLGQGHPAAALDGFIAGLVRYGLSPQAAAGIPIIGTPARAAERFRQYAEAGVEHLILGVIGPDWQRQYELIAEARGLAEHP
jgi:alkanesulfonate monooxygenase SsuD/methylene tetrahydromethanopterin reductase-like flavin-dependent oxidoreductase (luciferase family)